MATLIRVDGTTEEIDLGPSDASQLKKLQELVGGYIETLRLDVSGNDWLLLVLNEDGKRDKTMNTPATLLAMKHAALQPGDWIAGDAVVCTCRGAGTDAEHWA